MPYSYWYAKPLAYLKTLKKPICIAEFGSVEKGGSKAAWLADALARVAADSNVKAIVYYDANDTGGVNAQAWRVDTSPASLAAFRAGIARPYFLSGSPAALASWANGLTLQMDERLSRYSPLY